MWIHCLILLLYAIVTDADHFNGGTIRWVPLDPYDNSNLTTISIVQSYIWDYYYTDCDVDVPISTFAYATKNQNLTCVGNCSANGGYSTKPINILTDCTSYNSVIDVMTSEKTSNITLTADAHFALSYTGSGWRTVGQPSSANANWSITVSIDLRKRPDGFINTPPTASVFSPQYAFPNTPVQIRVRATDVNEGDDIRCRWATKSGSPVVDECGNACHPASMPSTVSLSNCTLNFTGSVSNTWYAIAIQVEDFINTTSTTAMSSIPVQFLVFVDYAPGCSPPPVFQPFTGCLEASVGVVKSFSIYALLRCSSYWYYIKDISVTDRISGMTSGSTFNSPSNVSLYYKTFTWTPSASQVGPQQLCMIAYTDENVQSTEYCVTFNVITTAPPCATTTTTSTTTTTTSKTTSTTSRTTSTTTSTTSRTTSTTATTTTTTTTTTSTSTSTTTTTTSTSTSTTSTSTSTTSTTTTTTSTSTSTTSTTTSTSSTSTSTTTTSATTTTTTSVTTVTGTGAESATNAPGKTTSWILIAAISSAIIPLALFTCCCVYRLMWGPGAKRRRQLELEEEDNAWEYNSLNTTTTSTNRIETSQSGEISSIEVPKKSYQVYNMTSESNHINLNSSSNNGQGSILVSMYNHTNGKRLNDLGMHDTGERLEMGETWARPRSNENASSDTPLNGRSVSAQPTIGELPSSSQSQRSLINNNRVRHEENFKASSLASFSNNRVGNLQPSPKTPPHINQTQQPDGQSTGLKDWTRIYLFGSGSKTDISAPQSPSS